jgi:hypothetical protein
MLLLAFLYIQITMSLIPSSPLVEVKLNQLREERAAKLAAFKVAVEEARIGWEAELILALEEFRDAGGFTKIQEEICAPRIREQEDPRANYNKVYRCIPNDESSVEPPYYIGENEWQRAFYPDIVDCRQALHYSRQNLIIPEIKGDPTMISERANFRYKYLKGVYEELKLNSQTEADLQRKKDLAFLELRRADQREEAEARRRLGLGNTNLGNLFSLGQINFPIKTKL